MPFGRKRYFKLIGVGLLVLIVTYSFYIYRRGVRVPVLKEYHHLISEDKETQEISHRNVNHTLVKTVHTYHIPSEDTEESGMHLITNYPLMTETPWIEAQGDTNKSRLWERQLEVEDVLQRNLNNTLVKAVHILVNQPSAEQRLRQLSFHNKDKLVVRRIESLPKYKDFFLYTNEKLLNRLVVMLNMDIYIGEGFELLNRKRMVKRGIAYVLTRHGRQEQRCDMSGRRGYCEHGYGGSHDTYVFVLTRRLDESELSELDYDANVYGAENRLVWILKRRLKKKLLNPCKILKTYHSHCINIHGRFRPRIKKNVGNVRISTGLYNN